MTQIELKNLKKGKLIAEGKTKALYEVKSHPELLWVKNKEDITAFDDEKFTKSFATKSVYATNTTCRVFELLGSAGIPVAYVGQVSDTEFIAPRLDMVNLEVVGRRYAVGSYLDRNPNLAVPDGEQPHRFHSYKCEFFLKTTGGQLLVNGMPIVSGLKGLVTNKKTGRYKTGKVDDPWIPNPEDSDEWRLVNPKLPEWHEKFDLGKTVNPMLVVRKFKHMTEMKKQLLRTAYVLEKAWAILLMRKIDFKIEFGYDMSGNLLIGDVIDGDSWRLRDQNWVDFSKQSFRDGEDLSKVEKKYGYVSKLADRLSIPKQVIVIWRGSPDDSDLSEERAAIGKEANGSIEFVDIVASGHKKSMIALDKLNKLEGKYLQGGFVITNVGRSNGLGPTLACHTSWPVQSICATYDEHPEDIYSSVNMPSGAPHTATPYPKLALMAALNHLALSNPVAYMIRAEALEKLDNIY